MACTFEHETRLRALGFSAPAGVDEAGRGCLFGPVTAAAVILPPDCSIERIRDSKTVPAPERARLASRIKAESLAWAVGYSSVAEITRINILEASRLAMLRAVNALSPPPDALLIDAIRIPSPLPQYPLIKGDSLSRSIAAASILAKFERDRLLAAFDRRYPQYCLASNKGYGTADHLAALSQYGPTSQHRASFAPVREIIVSRESRS